MIWNKYRFKESKLASIDLITLSFLFLQMSLTLLQCLKLKWNRFLLPLLLPSLNLFLLRSLRLFPLLPPLAWRSLSLPPLFPTNYQVKVLLFFSSLIFLQLYRWMILHRCIIFSVVLSEAMLDLSPSASSSLPSSPPSSSSAATDLPPLGGDIEDDEGMKHLQQVPQKWALRATDKITFGWI